jgi:hypothetical protein
MLFYLISYQVSDDFKIISLYRIYTIAIPILSLFIFSKDNMPRNKKQDIEKVQLFFLALFLK